MIEKFEKEKKIYGVPRQLILKKTSAINTFVGHTINVKSEFIIVAKLSTSGVFEDIIYDCV